MKNLCVLMVAAAAALVGGIACGSSDDAASSDGGGGAGGSASSAGAGGAGVGGTSGGAGAGGIFGGGQAGVAGAGGFGGTAGQQTGGAAGEGGSGGAATGGTATGGAASGGAAGQGASAGAGGEGASTAQLPKSKRFDLTKPSYDLFRNKALHGKHHAMQSFAFDNKNRRLFVAQIQDGSSGDDLCISQLSFSGALLGHMHLNGAGHGVSIGVEPVGTDSYLWVETDSNNTTDSGRGTALLRFKFQNGKAPSGKKFLTGSKTITCATDPVNERIAVRRSEGGKMFYSIFPLASAAKGDFSQPLAHFAQPSLSSKSVVFQGYTIYGQYLYTLDGTGHDHAADINSYVTAIDMLTGKVKSRALTKAGGTLVYREPEGMGVYRTSNGETRLFLGFASRDGSNRYASLFYKNVLID